MSSCNRRAALSGFLSGLAGLALAGCGFAPLHGGSGTPADQVGRIRILPVPGRAGHFLTSVLLRRLGDPAEDYQFVLSTTISSSSRVVVIGDQEEQLRFQIRLTATYELKERDSSRVVAENDIEVLTSVDATESAYAAHVAEGNRVQSAAEQAAERILVDIYLHLALLDG